MIDHRILKNCDFYPWLNEENDLLIQLTHINNHNLEDQEKMQELLEALDILKAKVQRLMFENRSTLTEDEITVLMEMLGRHIGIIRAHEGRQFEKCRSSVNISLRLIQFLLCSLYDYPDHIFGPREIPGEIRGMI
jgi:predicted XRE-type DNA-binding protein